MFLPLLGGKLCAHAHFERHCVPLTLGVSVFLPRFLPNSWRRGAGVPVAHVYVFVCVSVYQRRCAVVSLSVSVAYLVVHFRSVPARMHVFLRMPTYAADVLLAVARRVSACPAS